VQQTIIFCDGASKGNPGVGGWGAVVSYNGLVFELGGRKEYTTNNIMELTSAYSSILFVKQKKEWCTSLLSIFTDSKYLVNGATLWIYSWQKNGWKTKDGRDVLNKDLWQKILDASKDLEISWKYVPGHSGILLNERVDEIASLFAEGQSPKLFSGTLNDYPFSKELKKILNGQVLHDNTAKPYYLSFVDGKFTRHENWDDCKKTIHGQSGARYKKVKNIQEEELLKKQWGNVGL
jgi:ribonuclease HI